MKRSVYLRAFEPDDYAVIHQWRNDEKIQSLTGGVFRFVSSEMEKKWVLEKCLNNKTDIYLSICLNDGSDKMIGYLSINDINPVYRSAFGGGILIGDKESRDGETVLDAMYLQIKYVFEELNMNRFSGSCLTEHKTSLLLMQAMGLSIEGELRNSVYKGGAYHNQYLLAILREEYDRINKENGYDNQVIIKRYIKQCKLYGIK